MKEVWKAIYDKLTADTLLVNMLGHDTEHKMIQRGYNLEELGFDNNHTGGVLYRQWTGVPIALGVNIKNFTFIIVCLSKESDIQATDIAERIIEVLDGANLSAPGGYFYECIWDSYDSGVYFNKDDDAWSEDLRFRITATKDI
jgi:hypothetical protein